MFTAFDALKGRGRELARYDIDPAVDYNYVLSPESSRIAVIKRSEGVIHLLSTTRQPQQAITVKGWNAMENVDWTPDERACSSSVRCEAAMPYMLICRATRRSFGSKNRILNIRSAIARRPARCHFGVEPE